jgi:lipopolysaccharide export system permease protein
MDPRGIPFHDVWIISAQGPPFFQQEVRLPHQLTLKDLTQQSPNPQWIGFWSMLPLIKLMTKAGVNPYKYILEWHRLWALSCWLVAMVLLASACGLRSHHPERRRGSTLPILICGLSGALILYFVRDITYALGGARYLPVLLAAWAPCILTFLTALILLLYWEEGQV